jgi:hypothetical protein
MAAFFADCRTTHQTTFSLMPEHPDGAAVCDTAEDKAVFDVRSRQPVIEGSLYPARYRHRAHVATLPEEVNNGPVIVSLLEVR